MTRPGVDAVGGSGISVYDLTALAALDGTGLAQGTQVYVATLGRSYYMRGAAAPLLPGSVAVSGVFGSTWAPIVASPVVAPAGLLNVGGVSVSGLAEWKRADVDQFTFSGTWPTTASWLDKSGNARTETATGTPQWLANAINGRPGVVTANGSYFSNVASNLVAAGTARTCIIVAKSNNAAGGRLRTFKISGQVYLCELLFAAGSTFIYGDGVSTNGLLVDNPTFNGVPMILEFSFDGSASGADAFVRVRINGVDHGIVNGQTVSDTGVTGFSTGTLISDQGNNWVGPICEIITFSRTLNPVEKAAIYAYLSPYYTIDCQTPIQVMPLGDSTTIGLGDGTTTVTGGWRQAVSALHPRLQFIGGVYTPHSSALDGSGLWNRCEGHSGFTSGPIVPPGAGQGIGGPQLQSYLGTAGTIPDLVLLQIGQNDAGLGTYTAAQTATNIGLILDFIYAAAPGAKVIVMRANRQRSNQAANNAVIVAQGTTVAAAIAGRPNVLGPLELPPDQPDANYINDDHFNAVGYANNAAAWHQALVARGY